MITVTPTLGALSHLSSILAVEADPVLTNISTFSNGSISNGIAVSFQVYKQARKNEQKFLKKVSNGTQDTWPPHSTLKEPFANSLVTQPMLQRRPNRTELRSMDSYIQILCRFQKCKRKVPQPSLLSTKK